MNHIAEEILIHYGMPRRSGRYPWGSGEDPYQRTRDFLSRVDELKKSGWVETSENIKKEFGLTVKEYRNEKSIAKDQRRMVDVETAKRLRDKEGLGNTDIGRRMGINESTVRSLLNENTEGRMYETKNTVDFLRSEVNKKGMIDVGKSVDHELRISKERLDLALYYLEKKEGYPVYMGGIPQVTNPGQQTNQRVLCKPGTEHKEIYEYDRIKTISEYQSNDGGITYKKFQYPSSMDSSRLMVRYKNDKGPDGATGDDKDGIIEIRRGVDDLSLGTSKYSQVRILVDGTHYLKGMAVYSDNMPDGIDVVFNTNKKEGTPALGPKDNTVLKAIKKDPDNPFGSLIKPNGQSEYVDANGKKQLSLINKRSDEGDWSEWKDALPSQFLAKQNMPMIKKQLSLAKADKAAEFDAICELNNPTIKKHLLKKFSDECDSAAVHLQAAALPGQKYHVIIPINSLKDTEVYAPGYEQGTKLALVRYPHGGTFEIPILTVNNKNALGGQIIGKMSMDAVGINKHNADRLSGADFDGDTVMVIPTHDKAGKVKVASSTELQGLKGFDPKLEYGPETYKGQTVKLMRNTGQQMGVISNLITDMTLAGASRDELARAVRHSMVVIDAEKHSLNYKQSEIDNDIESLKKKYQAYIDEDGSVKYGGAATILSRAKGQASIDKTQGSPKINIKGSKDYDPTKPEGAYIYKKADDLYYPDRKYDKSTGEITIRTVDGKKVTYKVTDKEAADRYTPVKKVDPDTGEVTYTDKTGTITYKLNKRTQRSTRMAETDDAYTLVSTKTNAKELEYADYANYMKNLANTARVEMVNTGKIEYSKAAKDTYKDEVKSLEDKLRDAELNATRERAAQRLANAEVNAKRKIDPDMKTADVRKLGQQSISKYRDEVGSISRRNRSIKITDREWEAIQAGAISENKLIKILNNTDIDELRQRATPKVTNTLSTAQINKIKAMSNSNFTLEQIAKSCGVSTSTVSKYLRKE